MAIRKPYNTTQPTVANCAAAPSRAAVARRRVCLAARRLAAVTALVLIGSFAAHAANLNNKVLNRPYADMRAWHLGFSIGLNSLDFNFHHNGFTTDEGQTWFMEQPDLSPGFSVTGLIDFRLNDYFSVRLSPGIYFGNRVMRFKDTTSGEMARQDLKSAYLVAPVDLKYASQRLRNMRPYMVAGVMPAVDVLKKQPDFLRIKPFDTFLTIGLGCDIYLPYFKLIPELKFCFGLTDVIEHNRPDLDEDPFKLGVSNSLKRATSKMIVLSFYFE